jgi:PAS domain S-box-containing protein
MEQASAAIIVHDLKGKIIDANQQASKSLGYIKEELVQMSIGEIDREAIETGKDNLWPHVVAGQSFTFESKQKEKMAEFFQLKFTLGPIMIDKDTLIMALIKDVTERKKAEAALKESEEKLSRVFAATPNAICLMDVASRQFNDVNESSCVLRLQPRRTPENENIGYRSG